MKSVLLTIAVALIGSVAIAAANPDENVATHECYPEIGGGSEVLKVEMNWETRKASLFVDDKPVQSCQNAKFTGDFVEYGEATVKIKCKGGLVLFNQQHDEWPIEIDALKLGLSDTTYMCD